MLKEEFEQLAGCKVDAEVYEKVIEFTYLSFWSLSLKEVAAMYVATDSETHALFDEGYALARELEILKAKEKAYEAKVHAANLEERLSKDDGEDW